MLLRKEHRMAKGKGRWRRGQVKRIAIAEYSVGPQNVNLDGSNYRGARGAGYADLSRMLNKARDDGVERVTVAGLIKRTSGTKGFRWVSRSGYDVGRMLEDIHDASIERGVDLEEFTKEVFFTDFPTDGGAVTWSVVGY
jgi:hypothetical protein